MYAIWYETPDGTFVREAIDSLEPIARDGVVYIPTHGNHKANTFDPRAAVWTYTQQP